MPSRAATSCAGARQETPAAERRPGQLPGGAEGTRTPDPLHADPAEPLPAAPGAVAMKNTRPPKAAAGVCVELRGLEPLTPCMPIQQSRYQLRRRRRARRTPAAEGGRELVELRGLEPLTPCMPIQQSRYQLRRAPCMKNPGAEGGRGVGGAEGTRTPDPLHAMPAEPLPAAPGPGHEKPAAEGGLCVGGAEGTRTPDPLHAMQVRYQLRHSPICCRQATRGILANRLVTGEIAPGGAVGVLADGRGLVVGDQPQAADDLGCSPSTAQPQLSMPRRPREVSGGQPSRAEQRRPAGGAVHDHDRRLAGASDSRQLASGRAASALADDLGRTPRPRPSSDSSSASHAAYSLGCALGELRRGSAPTRTPTSYSRSRASYVGPAGRRPRRRTPRSPGRGPGRWTTDRPGRSAARYGATAAAWACPMSSREMSACPWARPRGVPGGLAVPEQDEPPRQRLTLARGETTSAGSGIDGQSRHSRSRA